MAATLPSHNENDCIFDPVLVYDAVLGADVPAICKQAAVEAVTKLPPHLEKYTSRTVPAHPCELLIDNAWSKLSVIRDFCAKVAKVQLLMILFKQMRGSNTAQDASKLKSQRGNPFLRSDLINPVDFNPLTDYCKLDAELLRFCERFIAKYEESLVM